MENLSAALDNSSAEVLAAGCDDSFGPAARGCHPRRFDLTLLFQQSVLSLGPCVLLLLVLLPRAVHLSRVKPKVLRHPVGLVKIVAYATLVLLHLALLVAWSRQNRRATSVSLAAATLGFVDVLALGGLSHLEHDRSVRPSSVILVYLFFSCAFDVVQCRTLWLLGEQPLAPLFSATLAGKLLVFGLELVEKRRVLLPPWTALAPETTSSVINRSVFWWLNRLLLRGFQATLQTDDLYPLSHGLKSKPLLDKLLRARQRWTGTRGPGRYRLLLAMVDSLGGALAVTAFPRLCLKTRQEKSAKPTARPEAEDLDDLSRRTGDSSLYFYYFRSIGWKLGLTALSLCITDAFLAQFSQIWLKWWTEANDGHAGASTAMYYGVYVALLCAWVVLVGIDCWFMFVVVIPKSAEWLHWKLLETTMRAPMAFFSSVDTGDLVNRFSQDMSLVDRELPTAAYTSLAGLRP